MARETHAGRLALQIKFARHTRPVAEIVHKHGKCDCARFDQLRLHDTDHFMSEPDNSKAKPAVLLLGASGTIGRAVGMQVLVDGYALTAIVRDTQSGRDAASALENAGASVIVSQELDEGTLAGVSQGHDVIISCLASRTGAPKDAWAIDYAANLAALNAAKAADFGHFIYLSAICVQKPKLSFQHAKLKLEAALTGSGLKYSIVRPTAFFKSLSGQIERVKAGKPFLIFGDGEQTSCKPISDRDLARYLVDCIDDETRHNRILPIGGPGPAITPREQGKMLSDLVGREPKFRSVPLGLFTIASRVLGLGARFSDWCAEKSEYARIARYYASESMLAWDADLGVYDAAATPEAGGDLLIDHYRTVLKE